jgi:hypothetical protein
MFYLIRSEGIAPNKSVFTEGHSRFRTSGGTAAEKTRFKDLCGYR